MTKTDPKKEAAKDLKDTGAAKEKPADNVVAKAAGGVFAEIKAKTPIDSKKIDD